jgi:2-polyprenyl-6-methoxyphenol hydroxylase-like FAD-dependent oxidoreductase
VKTGKILIVGGGISGLVLAIALRRRGLDVEIVELQPQWEILGVGISLTGPTLRAIKSIDLLDQCANVAFGFDRIIFCDSAGARVADLNMPRLAGPDCPATIAISRRALHEVLLQRVAELGVAISLGTTIASLKQDANAVVVRFSTGATASYDFVVGCDGAHSVVRDLVFSAVPKPNFTGLAVWRATMPRPAQVDCMQVFYGPRTKAGVNPHSKEEMFLFLVEQIPEGRRVSRDRLPVVLRGLLADFSGDVMTYVRENVGDPASIDHRPMNAFLLPPPWHRGRTLVIGDAAHTTTPHLATGAGIAIEDAVVLAELLAANRPPDALFDEFMMRRFDRCRLVVETAVKLGEMEKDTTIPIQAHFDLMTTTFRQLAQPI